MAKSDPDGNVEVRVKFPMTVASLLEQVANYESRSLPGMVRHLTLEGLAFRGYQRKLPTIIQSIIQSGKVKMENGGS